MHKGIDTQFKDAVVPTAGNKASGANYDEYAGTASGDSDSGGVLGKILTSYTIDGISAESKPDAGVGDYKVTY